jgi:hypothetical protein
MNSVTILDQIEITSNGSLQVRFNKLMMNGDLVMASRYHRTSFFPGQDIDSQATVVNNSIVREGWPSMTTADVQKIKDHAVVAWTDEVIAAYKAALEAK